VGAAPKQPTRTPDNEPYTVAQERPYRLAERDMKTVRKETKKSVGMATVIGGLLLYFVNTSRKKYGDV
jgi:hypothetical protein